VKIFLVILLSFAPNILYSQTYLTEDFSGTFPPSGWVIDNHMDNWSTSNSNNAGGTAPEARFEWEPLFLGDSYLISPPIDLSAETTAVRVKFKHMLDSYIGSYTIGVATRSGGGNWNVVWQIVDPPTSIPATEEIQTISNNDVGAPDFQICWFFNGNSSNLNYWYIDDISLFTPFTHDVLVRDILVDSQYVPGSTVTPKAVLKNFGNNTETFDATCQIKIEDNTVYTQTCSPVTLDPNTEQIVTFPDYIASIADELFHISVRANLTGDMDTTNNVKSKWFNTYTTEREMVLLEIGTGTWCTYCPGASLGANDLIDSGKTVAVIEYHYGDTFTNTFSEDRIDYYNIFGFPTSIFDGTNQFSGGSHTESLYQYYLPIYESRKSIYTAYTIQVFGEHSENEYNLSIFANKVAPTPPYNNVVLQVVLTESDIDFNWQGQTQVDFTERMMIPDQEGTILDFSTNNTQIINLNFTMDTSWVPENCELVAFIQNNDGKEIYQGTKVKLLELSPFPSEVLNNMYSGPKVFSLTQNFPNPFNSTTVIKYTVPNQSMVTIKLYNSIGQEVMTLVKEVKDIGTYQVSLNASKLSSGVYIYQMTAGNFVSSKKLILLR
jgi:hypothetical protein